jgi:4-hydroxythreonine-4-phosphate dehydrogenase
VNKKLLLLTMGDPCGIAPEITYKAWKTLKTQRKYCFAVIAQPEIFDYCNNKIKIITAPSEAINVFQDSLPLIPIDGHNTEKGHPNQIHTASILESIKLAVDICAKGKADGLVTNPISKEILYKSGFNFPGHTEYLGEITKEIHMINSRGPVMMLSGGGLKIALITVHVPLKKAALLITKKEIIKKAKVINEALIKDFGIKNPRIALAGINPHAGENGQLGLEEMEIINPAAETLRKEGINISDALPADTLFHEEARSMYDAAIAMYHDQGLIPIKTLDFYGGVNITLGLPIVRTSPDHGTAFNIAGKNIARPDSLIAAIKTAREISDNRAIQNA